MSLATLSDQKRAASERATEAAQEHVALDAAYELQGALDHQLVGVNVDVKTERYQTLHQGARFERRIIVSLTPETAKALTDRLWETARTRKEKADERDRNAVAHIEEPCPGQFDVMFGEYSVVGFVDGKLVRYECIGEGTGLTLDNDGRVVEES